MGIVVVPSFGADPVSITGPGLDAKVDGLATEFNGNIDNDNIKSAAAIANSKLNLASISQNITHSGTMSHTGAVTLGAVTTMSAKAFDEAKGANIASSGTTTIWATDGNLVHVTGTTTITSFGTAAQAGAQRVVVFDGALTLTHNATSLILPGGANITTAAGDIAIVRAETTANARVISYTKADGTAVVGATAGPAFHVHKNGTDQTGVAHNTETLVTWSTESFDTAGNFASNTFTPTTAGKYFLHAKAQFNSSVDQTLYAIYIFKNGALFKRGVLFNASGTGGVGVEVSALVDANGSTDAFTIYVVHTAGSDRVIEGDADATYFEGFYVRS